MTDYCPNCGEDRPLREERRREPYHVRGESIEVDADVLVCTACGEDVAEPTRDDRTLRAAYDEYRRRYSMLSPERIRELRERYGLSQRGLARLLGWGEITIHRYENGALQDAAHDQVLQQLDDPRFVLSLLERYGDRLTPRERETVRNSALGHRAAALLPKPLTEEIERRIGSRYSIDGIERGFRRLNIDRTGFIVQWFAFRSSDLFKTKLAKLLWLSDFAHFHWHHISLTGLVYARGTHGPVPDKFGLLLDTLEEEGIIRISEGCAGSFVGDMISALDPVPIMLVPEEIDTLERVTRKFGHLSGKELSDLSHQEAAWLNRDDGEPIPYSEADRLQLLASL